MAQYRRCSSWVCHDFVRGRVSVCFTRELRCYLRRSWQKLTLPKKLPIVRRYGSAEADRLLEGERSPCAPSFRQPKPLQHRLVRHFGHKSSTPSGLSKGARRRAIQLQGLYGLLVVFGSVLFRCGRCHSSFLRFCLVLRLRSHTRRPRETRQTKHSFQFFSVYRDSFLSPHVLEKRKRQSHLPATSCCCFPSFAISSFPSTFTYMPALLCTPAATTHAKRVRFVML